MRQCIDCGRATSSGELRCAKGRGCRRHAFITPPPSRERDAPECPRCDRLDPVVLYRPAGVPWYGGPWRHEVWRCCACHINFADEAASALAV